MGVGVQRRLSAERRIQHARAGLDAPVRDEVDQGGNRLPLVDGVGEDVLEPCAEPDLDLAAEMRTQLRERCNGRRAEGQRDALEIGEAHRAMLPEPPKSSRSMCTSPTRSKPRRSRIGRDIVPPCVISAGVPSATASSQRARIKAR